MSRDLDSEMIDIEKEKEKIIKALEGMVETVKNVLENHEKITNQEVGVAEKLEAKHDLTMDQISLATMVAAAAIAKTSEKISEIKEKIAQKANIRKEKLTEKDATKEWDKAIQEKKCKLQEDKDNKLQMLAQNEVMQESQIKDAKKEGHEEQLNQLKKLVHDEKENINKKFQDDNEKLKEEQNALLSAIEKAKDIEAKKRQEEIEKARQEYERKRELQLQRGR